MSSHTPAAESITIQPQLNLEQQRKRARALLKAARAQDSEALGRVAAVLPDHARRSSTSGAPTLSLHDAQLVVAREHGFASWARLKAHIQAHTPMTPLGTLSLIAAAHRALETELANPLYRDALAGRLAGEAGWASMRSMREMKWAFPSSGPDPYFTIRTKYFDGALTQVLKDPAIRQLVILGAGMDTRAFRLDWPNGVAVFEVDRDEVFDRKEPLVRTLHARPVPRRRIVRADLGRAWISPLVKAGFDPERKTAFLLEGVLLFLEEVVVQRLFRDLARIACQGSWIGLDLVTADTVTSPFMTPFLTRLAALGQPSWKFAVNEPEAFLAQFGWDATSGVAGAPEANYGRWPYGYTPRGTPGIPRIFLTQGWMTSHNPASSAR